MSDGALKPVRWVGSSLRDLRSLPPEVRADIGQAIYTAQRGLKDPAAKPLNGFEGTAVMEIVAPFDGDAWRAVYTVRPKGFIHVLHVFQKKSKSGTATPKKEIDLIRRRLQAAYEDYQQGQNR